MVAKAIIYQYSVILSTVLCSYCVLLCAPSLVPNKVSLFPDCLLHRLRPRTPTQAHAPPTFTHVYTRTRAHVHTHTHTDLVDVRLGERDTSSKCVHARRVQLNGVRPLLRLAFALPAAHSFRIPFSDTRRSHRHGDAWRHGDAHITHPFLSRFS